MLKLGTSFFFGSILLSVDEKSSALFFRKKKNIKFSHDKIKASKPQF